MFNFVHVSVGLKWVCLIQNMKQTKIFQHPCACGMINEHTQNQLSAAYLNKHKNLPTAAQGFFTIYIENQWLALWILLNHNSHHLKPVAELTGADERWSPTTSGGHQVEEVCWVAIHCLFSNRSHDLMSHFCLPTYCAFDILKEGPWRIPYTF